MLIVQISIVALVAGIIFACSIACIAAESDKRMSEALRNKLKEIEKRDSQFH